MPMKGKDQIQPLSRTFKNYLMKEPTNVGLSENRVTRVNPRLVMYFPIKLAIWDVYPIFRHTPIFQHHLFCSCLRACSQFHLSMVPPAFRPRTSHPHLEQSVANQIVELRPGRVRCPGKCVLTAQGQCFMRFGMSSISPDGWRDWFPKHETLNPKPQNLNLTWNPKYALKVKSYF